MGKLKRQLNTASSFSKNKACLSSRHAFFISQNLQKFLCVLCVYCVYSLNSLFPHNTGLFFTFTSIKNSSPSSSFTLSKNYGMPLFSTCLIFISQNLQKFLCVLCVYCVYSLNSIFSYSTGLLCPIGWVFYLYQKFH